MSITIENIKRAVAYIDKQKVPESYYFKLNMKAKELLTELRHTNSNIQVSTDIQTALEKDLAVELRKLRFTKKRTAARVANAIGISTRHLSKMENGERRMLYSHAVKVLEELETH